MTYRSVTAPTCLHSCCFTDEDLGSAARDMLYAAELGRLPNLEAAVRLLAERAAVAQRSRMPTRPGIFRYDVRTTVRSQS